MPDAPTSAASDSSVAIGPVALADGLGWASASLGAPMLLTPRRFLRTIGVRPDGTTVPITAGVGAREFAATATILGMRHRRVGAWSRVGGDMVDLALLAAAFTTKRDDGRRLLGAICLVAAILGADVFTAVRLSRAEGTHIDDGSTSHGTGAPADSGGGPARVRTAITIKASEDDVRRAFREFDWRAFDAAQLERAGDVRFVPAPGGRGVELHVDHDPSAPGGAVGHAVLKLAGRAPDQQINDDFRRFKALIETGVVVRSDKTPEGPSSGRQMLQQPGQPIGGRA